MVVKLELRVFENRVLTMYLELTREKITKVTRDWIILHNVEHHDLYFSPGLSWTVRSKRTS
jgi:DNA mismatch repair ATPase MutS